MASDLQVDNTVKTFAQVFFYLICWFQYLCVAGCIAKPCLAVVCWIPLHRTSRWAVKSCLRICTRFSTKLFLRTVWWCSIMGVTRTAKTRFIVCRTHRRDFFLRLRKRIGRCRRPRELDSWRDALLPHFRRWKQRERLGFFNRWEWPCEDDDEWKVNTVVRKRLQSRTSWDVEDTPCSS